MTDNNKKRHVFTKSILARKFIIYIVLFSSVITVVGTSLQLYLDYREDKTNIQSALELIETTHLKSIVNNLWVNDREQLNVRLDEILSLPDIQYISIDLIDEETISVGTRKSTNILYQEYPLIYFFRDKMINLGNLQVEATLENAYQRLRSRVILILLTQGIKTFLVSLFIFTIFYFLISRHLTHMANYSKSFDLDHLDAPLTLDRFSKSSKNDEIETLVISINEMRVNLHEDIAERKKSEAALRKSEENFKGLFACIRDAILVADTERSIINCNPAFLDLFGYSLNEIKGRKTLILYENKDHFIELGNALKEHDGTDPFLKTVNYRKKTGEIFPGETGVYYLKDSNDKVTGFIGLIRNVAERISMQENLVKSQEQYQIAMDAAEDGLYDWNLLSNQIYYSPGWKRMLGYEDQEIPNDFSIWEKLTHPDDIKKSWEMQQELVEKKRGRFELEFRMKHKSGHWVDILSRAKAIFDESDKAVRIIGTHIDVTERKRLEASLLQAQKMESIGNLAGGIAHDFNNILSSILGFAELGLDEVEKSSNMEDNLQEIYAGGLRAKDIVSQILAFARQSDIEKKAIRVDVIITEALKLILPSTPSTIEIKQEIESSSLIMGNATQIHQIIMNLCTNAAHAMQDSGGVMEVALKDVLFGGKVVVPKGLNKGKYMELTISDTGCGINPDYIESIFDPYFTTKETGQGTGMGLAMVSGIVDSYGGSITVESTPSTKTVFTIYLPITSNRDNGHIYTTATLPKGDEHILFVDDEPPIARMGSRILESLGYQVTTRTSSVEALELFKAKPDEFQLVITDMTMPHMTGDKFAKECRQIRADIPIILCTGYSNKINAEIAQDIGINAFTYKPFSKADLADCVREVLDNA